MILKPGANGPKCSRAAGSVLKPTIAERAAVKIAGADDDLGLPVRHALHLVAPFAHRLDRALHRLGAAVHRQHLVRAGQRRDLLVERGNWSLWKAREVSVSLLACSHHRGQDFWMAVALIDRRIGGEAVEITVAVDIPHPDAFAARQHDADRLVIIGAKAAFPSREIIG